MVIRHSNCLVVKYRKQRTMKTILLVLTTFLAVQLNALAQPQMTEQNSFVNELQHSEIKNDLKIYPNPVRNKKVTLEMPNDEMTEIRLVSIVGKEVWKKDFEFGTSKYQIKLENIPKGIYLVQVKTTENIAIVKKLLISEN